MAEPLSQEPGPPDFTPDEVAKKSFEVTRRGFDSGQVRAFLARVANALDDAQSREADIRTRLGQAVRRADEAEAHANAASGTAAADFDEAALTDALGDEVARVLKTAREVAKGLVAEAEADAQGLIDKAVAAADSSRRQAEEHVAERSAEAARLVTVAREQADETRAEAEGVLVERRAEGDKLIAEANAAADETRAEAEGVLVERRAEGDKLIAEAQEAAAKIRAEADEAAASIRAAAEGVLAEREAEAQVAKRAILAEGETAAAAELDKARAEADVLVGEAESARAQILADMERRRRQARAQVERLRAGRDRLLKSHDVVRRTLEEATSELKFSLAEAKAKGDAAARRIEADMPATIHEIEAEIADAAIIGVLKLPDRPITRRDLATATDDIDQPEVPEADAPEADVSAPDAPEVEAGVAEPDAPEAEAGSTVASLFATIRSDRALAASDVQQASTTTVADSTDKTAVDAEAPSDGSPTGGSPTDGDRSDSGEPDTAVEPQAAADQEVAATEELVHERDAALAPLATAGERRLKRILADEQNTVLDHLRRRKKNETVELDEALGSRSTQLARYVEAISDQVVQAQSLGASATSASPHEPVDDNLALHETVADLMLRSVVRPIRERMGTILESAGDDRSASSSVRSFYREHKLQRLAPAAEHVVFTAYSVGALASLVPGEPVRWVFVESAGGCADGYDNSLAGETPAGDAFPSGTSAPPVAMGCRCLLVPARR